MGSPAEWLARWSYAGLFVALLVEEAGIPLPIPGDLLLVAMGALAASGAVSPLPTVAVAVAAVAIGSAVLHAVTVRAGRPLLDRAAARLRLKAERLDRAEAFLARGGWAAVAVARWVPGLRIVTSAAAGTFRLPRPSFTAGVVTSAIFWSSGCFAVGWLGAGGLPASRTRLGGVALWPIAAAAAIPAAALLAWWRRRR